MTLLIGGRTQAKNNRNKERKDGLFGSRFRKARDEWIEA
jgi:hypothetical protein